jgi:predicted transcriptional regulator
LRTQRLLRRKRFANFWSRIIDFVVHNPGSTAGDVAKGLNLDPANVSTHLTQLAKAGEIQKAAHGYSTTLAVRPRKHQRPPHHGH